MTYDMKYIDLRLKILHLMGEDTESPNWTYWLRHYYRLAALCHQADESKR